MCEVQGVAELAEASLNRLLHQQMAPPGPLPRTLAEDGRWGRDAMNWSWAELRAVLDGILKAGRLRNSWHIEQWYPFLPSCCIFPRTSEDGFILSRAEEGEGPAELLTGPITGGFPTERTRSPLDQLCEAHIPTDQFLFKSENFPWVRTAPHSKTVVLNVPNAAAL